MLEQIKQNMKKEKSGIIEMNRDVINNRLDTK